MFNNLKKKVAAHENHVSLKDSNSSLTATSLTNHKAANALSNDSIESAEGVASSATTNDIISTANMKNKRRDDHLRRMENKVTELALIVRQKNERITALEMDSQREKLGDIFFCDLKFSWVVDVCVRVCDAEFERKLNEIKESSAGEAQSLLDDQRNQVARLEAEIKKLENRCKQYEKEELGAQNAAGSGAGSGFTSAVVDEERDYLEDLEKQELAKVKHMLIISEKQLAQSSRDLEASRAEFDTAEQNCFKLTAELERLQRQLEKSLDDREQQLAAREQLAQQNGELADRLDALSSAQTKTESTLRCVERSSAKLHDTLQSRTHELEQTRADLRRREEGEARLRDHIELLETRLAEWNSSPSLSASASGLLMTQHDEREAELDKEKTGDDDATSATRQQSVTSSLSALRLDRDRLEARLVSQNSEMTRNHEAWSRRVDALQEQICNLTRKISEDEEEARQLRNTWEAERANTARQTQELRNELAARQSEWAQREQHQRDTQTGWEAERADWLEQRGRHDAIVTRLTAANRELAGKNEEAAARVEELGEAMRCVRDDVTRRDTSVANLEARLRQVEGERDAKCEEISGLMAERFKRELKVTELNSQCARLETESGEMNRRSGAAEKELRIAQSDLKLHREAKQRLEEENSELRVKLRANESAAERELARIGAQIEALEADLARTNHELSEAKRGAELVVVQQDDAIAQQEEEAATTATGKKESREELHAQIERLRDENERAKQRNRLQKRQLADLERSLATEIQKARPGSSAVMTQSQQQLQQQQQQEQQKQHHQNINQYSAANDDYDVDDDVSNRVVNTYNGDDATITQQQQNGFEQNEQPNSKAKIINNGLHENNGKINNNDKNNNNNVCVEYMRHVIKKFLLTSESDSVQLLTAVATLLRMNEEEERILRRCFAAHSSSKPSWLVAQPQRPRLSQCSAGDLMMTQSLISSTSAQSRTQLTPSHAKQSKRGSSRSDAIIAE